MSVTGYFYDYGFRSHPVRGLFPNKIADPAYLSDGLGDILAWPGDIVIMVA